MVFGLLAGLAVFFAASGSALAATCTFASAGDSDFNTAGNWSCAHVPVAADETIIPASTSTVMSAAATVSGLLINSNATLTTTGFDLTVRDSVTSTGDLIAGGNTISIGNDLTFLTGFTFTPGTGTVTITTSTSDGTFVHALTFPASGATFNDLVVSTTQSVLPVSAGTTTIGGELAIIDGMVYLSSGADMTVTGSSTIAVDGIFSMEDSTSQFIANGTTTNFGVIGPLSSGLIVFNDDFINAGNVSSTAGETYSLTVKRDFINIGAFHSGSSTVSITGDTDQGILGELTFHNLIVSYGGGEYVKTFIGNVTTTGNMTNSAIISLSNFHYEPLGNVTNTLTMIALTIRVPSDKNQTWSGSGSQTAELRIEKPTGTTLTLSGDPDFWGIRLVSGTLNAGTGTVDINGDGYTMTMAGGTFTHGGGTIKYANAGGTMEIASTTYNNLVIDPTAGSLYNLSGTTTVLGTTSLSADARLNLQGKTLIATGLITNDGAITLNSGEIVHTAESTKVTNSSGVEVASISTGGSVYVTVQDSNRNLASSTAETMTVTLTMNAAGGSDSETLTLTETSSTSGVFRNLTGITVANSSAVSLGNNQLEITSDGVGTMTYTDNQDSADTATDTVTLSYTAAAAVAPSGGGGSGDPNVTGLPPVVTQQQQTLLNNLKTINVAIHNLVKLPDDGKLSTQEDTAVYYVGSDGKRHAFPNEKVYYTWYANFDSVKVITALKLASIPLGANVTYKPGEKMVKFTTDNKVYAVAKGGVLRWVVSENAAVELYGANWSKKIDDISDAFYVNYKFGNNASGLTDFNPTSIKASAPLPSDSLQM